MAFPTSPTSPRPPAQHLGDLLRNLEAESDIESTRSFQHYPPPRAPSPPPQELGRFLRGLDAMSMRNSRLSFGVLPPDLQEIVTNAQRELSPPTSPIKGRDIISESDVRSPVNLSKSMDLKPMKPKYEVVTWDGPSDPENPYNWPDATKFRVSFIVIWFALNAAVSSSISTTAIIALTEAFPISQEVSTLATSLFLLGYVFGPVLWSGLSETYGRTTVYMLTTFAYTMFSIAPPLSLNIGTLLVTRFFAGIFGSAAFTVPGGTFADMFEPIKRGKAVSLYSAVVFAGPTFGPVIGGFVVSSHLGWRWVFWITAIMAAAPLPFVFFWLPETCAPVILSRKAAGLRRLGRIAAYPQHEIDADPMITFLQNLIDRTVLRPFVMLSQEPILVLITLYISVVYGLVYGLFEAIPIVFTEIRGISLSLTGLIFFALGIGTSIGAVITFLDGRRWRYLTPKWRGTPPPEERLKTTLYAGPLFVIGILWLGWAGNYPQVPWYAVALSLIPTGVGITLVGVASQAYVVDTYLIYAASALSAQTMLRSAAGAAFPLFTPQMFDRLGTQWACTLLAGLMLLLAPIPYVFRRYGARIRARSKFAPCLDLKIRKEILGEDA